MLFKDIVGQQILKSTLTQAVHSSRLAHANLFAGKVGYGGLPLALALSQFVLCEDKMQSDSCGTCPSCIKAGKFIHPDVHFVFPVVGAKKTSNDFLNEWRKALTDNPYMEINDWMERIGAENKQANINKNECQQIVRKLSLKTFEGRHKILLVWLPEYLGKEGNRLLKILEEPPESTIFFLVAENLDLILNTILSRCQLTNINRPSDTDIIEKLNADSKYGDSKVKELVYLSDGNVNFLYKSIDSGIQKNGSLFANWLRICIKKKPDGIVKWVNAFSKIGREGQKHFLRYALHYVREIMALQNIDGYNSRLLEEDRETAVKLSNFLNYNQLVLISETLEDCAFAVERNANPKILMTSASIRIKRSLTSKPLAENI